MTIICAILAIVPIDFQRNCTVSLERCEIELSFADTSRSAALLSEHSKTSHLHPLVHTFQPSVSVACKGILTRL
jgi:hypothetical protein